MCKKKHPYLDVLLSCKFYWSWSSSPESAIIFFFFGGGGLGGIVSVVCSNVISKGNDPSKKEERETGEEFLERFAELITSGKFSSPWGIA